MFLRQFIFAALIGMTCLVGGAAAEPVSIVAVGDLLLGGSATGPLQQTGFDYPFLATKTFIEQADLAMANLEAPLTTGGERYQDKKFTFRVPPEAARHIGAAGFDILTLANNHMGDFGVQGVLDTLEALRQNGLGVAGAGRTLNEARQPCIREIAGETFAFLAYSNTFPTDFYATAGKPGTAPGYFDEVADDIRKAKKQFDHVIVSFHWGSERMPEPKDYQRELGHLAIDSGAEVVIGHHPHVLQGVERYRNGVIYYSLGNFAFGSYSPSSVTAGMARVWFDGGKLVKAEILPLHVLNTEVQFQPQPLLHGPAYAFAREFATYAEPLNTRLVMQPDPFWGIEKMPNTEDRIQETEEVLAQGQNPDRHQDTKGTKKSEKNL